MPLHWLDGVKIKWLHLLTGFSSKNLMKSDNMQRYSFDISWTIRGCSSQIRSKRSTCHKNYINALLWWIGKSFYFRKMEFQMTSRLIGIYGRRPNHTEAQDWFAYYHGKMSLLSTAGSQQTSPVGFSESIIIPSIHHPVYLSSPINSHYCFEWEHYIHKLSSNNFKMAAVLSTRGPLFLMHSGEERMQQIKKAVTSLLLFA